MRHVRRDEILGLAEYDRARPDIRRRVLDEKAPRRVHVGDSLTFLFETTRTAAYQVQEMLHAERIAGEPEIRHELDTYNEMLGGPGELGCVLLIEVADAVLRDQRLREWLALPRHLYVKTASGRRVRARYDERQVGEDRLSSVQYLKFDVGGEAPVAVGCDLPGLAIETGLDPDQRQALARDVAA